MKTNNENKELNKDSNKDLNKDLNKGSNEDLNKESNKDVTKKTNKESNGKKFKKIDFKELRKKSKEKRIQNKKNLKHGSIQHGCNYNFYCDYRSIKSGIAGSAVKIQRNRFKYAETLQHW